MLTVIGCDFVVSNPSTLDAQNVLTCRQITEAKVPRSVRDSMHRMILSQVGESQVCADDDSAGIIEYKSFDTAALCKLRPAGNHGRQRHK